MKIRVERVYEMKKQPPKNTFLVDRLWPRGITKDSLSGVVWLKDFAPSNGLRKWFHQNKEKRWKEFNKRYLTELKEKRPVARQQIKINGGKLTLLTGVKDIEHSHIPTLSKFLMSFM